MRQNAERKKKSLLGKLVILVFAVWSAVTLITLQAQINKRKAENAELAENLAAQQLLVETLREDTGSDDLTELYARLARERLGLVAPGEIIIVNKNP
ncbi:MAG: septum formation initiator family protein [Oscillospiraceae bacterium]|nr:septum formation initiator family protein [Oscillospiraceae bacterium]